MPYPTYGTVSKPVDESSPAITVWEPVLGAYFAAAGLPIPFGMGWLGIESGGNAAAVGSPTAVGPDGYPQEIGLFQIYNPDDFKALGVSPAELCAYCVRPAPGHPNPQRLTRPMTSAEIQRAMEIGRDFILREKAYADHYLVANSVRWPETSPDYWAMVKVVHALPSLVNSGIAMVVHKLGRPPVDWAEFKRTLVSIMPNAAHALDNAEWTGFHVQGPSASSAVHGAPTS